MTGPRTAEVGDAHEVLRLLTTLPPTDRDVVRLIYFQRLTLPQAAAALGLPPASVGRCLARGLQTLTIGLLNGQR